MFTLANLPYAEDALEPHISAETLSLHHGKHHKSYVDTLNSLLEGDAMADLPLEEVIMQTQGLAARQTVFNNAAQCWNHDFYWKSMKPGGGGPPTDDLKVMIEKDFGDTSAFAEAFRAAAVKHFGSGWVWLVATEGVIGIVATHDADLPLVHGRTALLCCDVWEHAYYLDYKNVRADFVSAFLDHLADWDFANANLAAAASQMNEEAPTGVGPVEAPFVIHAI
ncbi:MAG: superoxide dismutase [Sphingomonadaceae bacterium]